MTSSASEPPAMVEPEVDLSLAQIMLALAGPLIWAVHFMLAYLAAEGACRLNALGGPWLGLTGLGWFIVIATLLAFGLSAWAGLRAVPALAVVPGRARPRLAPEPPVGAGRLVAVADIYHPDRAVACLILGAASMRLDLMVACRELRTLALLTYAGRLSGRAPVRYRRCQPG